MSESTSLSTEHSVTIDAPARVVFDIVADVAAWPPIVASVIHAEQAPIGDAADRVSMWVLRDGEQVHAITTSRELDRDGGVITFRDEQAEAPLADSRGRWTIVADSGDRTTLRLSHEFMLAAGADADTRVTVEQNDQALVAALAEAAGRYKELPELIVAFEDPLYIDGDVQAVYDLLYHADEWPERFPHVKRIDMTEDVPNVQFFDMDTVTPDGRAHTTRSVRICFPNRKIVYKQIGLPPLLTAHLGHWLFEATPEGLIASARHEAAIKTSALAILKPDATVGDARRYLRRVLSANSLSNLRIAKQLVETPIG